MINNQKEYRKAMRSMILRVQKGEQLELKAPPEELEILAECIRSGYINGRNTYFDERTGREVESRTLDGLIHPEIINNIIPIKGLVFLHPQADWKFLVPTIISIVALVKSFFF